MSPHKDGKNLTKKYRLFNACENFYLIQLSNYRDAYDILLIFDESQTCFGRLGSWFAFEKYDVIPDMVCLAKGIGLGYP
ncbi:MAG: aminotransferase class III-fold pyridoxal phosphate-dependent enzyme, partial [Lachnospiraceae bacterium]|nr:aminotransferase class III-fold pyridoxal phosphate-dependent enzyme [Lachnospiraceae bacterium]